MSATSYAQSELVLTIANGRVTLVAQNVSLRGIVEEWRRVSGATIINGDRLDNLTPVTLQLTDVPEQSALATLLRDVAGYIVTLRADAIAVDRIFIVPESTAPAPASAVDARSSDMTPSPFTGAAFAETTPSGGVATPFVEATPLAGAASSTGRFPATGSATAQGQSAVTDSAPVLVDGAYPETVVAPELRPPTPLLPAPVSSDAGNPFGTMPGSATPGVITPTGPPPGVTIPKPTVPPAGAPQNTAKPR